MKKIKVRAWNPILKTMWNNFEVKIMNTELLSMELIDLELMTFTGATDLNGIEIYENDVIKHKNSKPFIVKYDEENYRYIAFNSTNTEPHISLMMALNINCVVVGNIYEDYEELG